MKKTNVLAEAVGKAYRQPSRRTFTRAGLGAIALVFANGVSAQCSNPGPIENEEFQFCDDNAPVCECVADVGYGGGLESVSDITSSSYDSIDIIDDVSDIGYGGTVCHLTVTDNRPHEDANNNGFLDPGEDLNGNGVFDEDTGIFGVELAPGSVNMALFGMSCSEGDSQCTFVLEQIDSSLPAVGEINAIDGFENACKPAFQLGGFDPFGGLNRTTTRNLTLQLGRPWYGDDDVEAVRCAETTEPQNPLPDELAFAEYENSFMTMDIDIESAGNGDKSVCCEYRSESGAVSPPACGFIELDEPSPDVPEGIQARAKPGKVDVVWDPVSNAESYNIFRADESGGPYTQVGSSVYGVYADFTVTSGETYYYVVQSVSGTLLSDESAEVSVDVPTTSSRRRRR